MDAARDATARNPVAIVAITMRWSRVFTPLAFLQGSTAARLFNEFGSPSRPRC